MNRIEVEGKQKLYGEIKIQGSKNSVLPILSASVLNEGETILHGCPRILDVYSLLEALESAGAMIRWEDDTLVINTARMEPVPFIEKAGKLRSSVMLLGSFLGRFGKAVIGYPGGCCIGKRPIDLHEQALSALGAVFCEEDTYLETRCVRLEGCDIHLPYPSVGVTENVLLAASKASGMTRIYGGAKEPEITELCCFLEKMGVRITGAGTDVISVMPKPLHKNVEYNICSDRIVAGTYLLGAIIAGGEVVLKEMPILHMKQTIRLAGELGAKLRRDGMDVMIKMEGKPHRIPYLATAPYPGFATDLQSPLLSVLCTGDGSSVIEERIFENRFLIVKELQKMGADLEIKDRSVHIRPVKKLKGAVTEAKDLRGAAALVLAALGAAGTSVIENAGMINRGYEDIVKDFRSLGANLSWSEVSGNI